MTSVDLTNCDREPIHVPGSIQPHGALIALDMAAGRILRHSANLSGTIRHAGAVNGERLESVIGTQAAHDIRNALASAGTGPTPSLLFGVTLPSGSVFDVAAHRYKSNTILEFEPVDPAVAQPLEMARALIGRITAIESVGQLVKDTARLIQAMLHYDRVMIYQFSQDGAGKVVSEAKRSDLESFLGQYFPATDIPQQARALYLSNTIRVISDASFEPVPIEPALDASGEPLDLSYAHLRSVSPIHCEYLRNMGVRASMSISIVVEGALWGLIACHHYERRRLAMAERVAAELFGEFFSLHLSALRQKHKLVAASTARGALDRFMRVAADVSDFDAVLKSSLPDFATLMRCDGVGLWHHGTWHGHGTLPPAAAAPVLARFAERVSERSVWATHNLSDHLPDAQDYAVDVAGVMIVPLSQRPRDYLFFFRTELVRTLDWAGNPDKTYESGPLGDRLTPRKSFAIWKETVHGQAEPWTDEEREIAEATRSSLVEVALRHNELIADERAKADVRQRMLNEELNHRVKNILAVIKSLVMNRGASDQTLETYIEGLRGRIQALSFAHDQVVRGDGGGSLIDLLNAELGPYRGSGCEIVLDGVPIWLDPRAFSVMALVVHELSTNAAKYGALSRRGGKLSVQWSTDESGACTIDWTESGGPEVRPPSRQGFGTVLVDRSVPFDLGGESEVHYRPSGVTARFRIPARHVAAVQRPTPSAPADAGAERGSKANLGGLDVLLVEDQMLIALDAEQILRGEGVGSVRTAPNTVDALSRLAAKAPDAAVLDVNLGAETSEVVADELARRAIPFVFATGYGDSAIIPERFAGIPIVRKPYDAPALLAALHRVLPAR